MPQRSLEILVVGDALTNEDEGVGIWVIADLTISLASSSFLNTSLRCSRAAGELLRNKYPQ